MGIASILRIMLGALVLVSAPVSGQANCGGSTAEQATIAAVEPRLEIRLADGRRLRLVGLDPALQTPTDPDLAEVSRSRMAALALGRPALVSLLSAMPDRWGRLAASVRISAPAPEGGDLAEAVIGAGLGRYLAEPEAHPCRGALLAAEHRARDARAGLWADPYYSVVAVDDRAALSERAGTLVVAQGRLLAVRAGPFRTKLYFAEPAASTPDSRSPDLADAVQRRRRVYAPHRDRLAIVIPRRATARFNASGKDVSKDIGSTLEVRGLLDLRFGPQIEIADPDAIEIVTQSAQTSKKDAAPAN